MPPRADPGRVGFDLPAIGDRVQIVVKGAAHVLGRWGMRPAALALARAPVTGS